MEKNARHLTERLKCSVDFAKGGELCIKKLQTLLIRSIRFAIHSFARRGWLLLVLRALEDLDVAYYGQ
jgi:hypothetical protein